MAEPQLQWVRSMNPAQKKLVAACVAILAFQALKSVLPILTYVWSLSWIGMLGSGAALWVMWQLDLDEVGEALQEVWWLSLRLGGALVACWLVLRGLTIAGVGASSPVNLWLMAAVAGDVAFGVVLLLGGLYFVQHRGDDD